MLRTMDEALQGGAAARPIRLPPLRAFYLATLGGARALRLEDRDRQLRRGREADFIVLDTAPMPLLARRARREALEEQLFAWMMLGDERAVREVYVMGEIANG